MIFVNLFSPSFVLHMLHFKNSIKMDSLQYKNIFTIFLFASFSPFL